MSLLPLLLPSLLLLLLLLLLLPFPAAFFLFWQFFLKNAPLQPLVLHTLQILLGRGFLSFPRTPFALLDAPSGASARIADFSCWAAAISSGGKGIVLY